MSVVGTVDESNFRTNESEMRRLKLLVTIASPKQSFDPRNLIRRFRSLALASKTTEPWMHAIMTVGGAWGANKWVQIENQLLADVNEIRAYKGLPPMVGTHYFPLLPRAVAPEDQTK